MNPKRIVERVKETAADTASVPISKFFEKSDFKTLKAAATLIDTVEVNGEARTVLKDGKVEDHDTAAEMVEGLVDGLQGVIRELNRIKGNRFMKSQGK